ncbi:MAG: SIMPL domain-containing protein [Candidatus Cybelea sp.]
MKRTFICLLAAFAVATCAAAAAQPSATEISASGSGSVTMAPDIATVDAGIETNAANANDAISQNNAIYERVVAALERLGVARADVALAYYNVNYNPRPRSAPPNPGERYGYTVSRTFTVKVRQIGKAGAVSDACTSAGATAINGVSFGLADSAAARTQATIKAVADARANAEALAQAAGLRIVAIKSMEVGGAGPPGPVPMMRLAAAPNPPTQFDQSNVNVTVSVSVVFLAEP